MKWLQLWGPVLFSYDLLALRKGLNDQTSGVVTSTPSWTDGTWALQAEKGTSPQQLSHYYIHLTTLSKEGGNHPFVPKAILWQLSRRQQLKLISWVPSGPSQWSTEGFHFPVVKNSPFFKDDAYLVVQLVKNSPAMQETPVQFLGWEDHLEKG